VARRERGDTPQIIYLGKTAEQAYTPFLGAQPAFVSFRDAAFSLCTFSVTVFDCLKGVAQAKKCKFLDFDTFDVAAFEYWEKLENGDISWVMPGKLAAFSGPLAQRREMKKGVFTLAVQDYPPVFKQLGITCVVRFNNKCYDRRFLTEQGIHHEDLFYPDGGNPTQEIVTRFLEICEREQGAVAVHCKAGLGRTGTNIGAYIMKHFHWTAREITAWHRMCRAGSIVGPQQQYLAAEERRLHALKPEAGVCARTCSHAVPLKCCPRAALSLPSPCLLYLL
jgi:cell division cycle 14